MIVGYEKFSFGKASDKGNRETGKQGNGETRNGESKTHNS